MSSTTTESMSIKKKTSDNELEFEAVYPHGPATVWRAITDPKEIELWFTKMEIEATVGTEYKLIHEGAVAVTGKILEVIPEVRFAYTWIVKGTTVETVVSWSLLGEDEGRSTRLVLRHTGLIAYGDSAPSMLASFTDGWQSCFSNLRERLG